MCHNPVELTAAFFLSVTVEKHHFLVFPTFYFPSDHTNPLISLLIIILIMGTEDTFQIWICHSYSLDYCTPLLYCTFRNNKVPLYLAVNKCESETQGIAQAQVRDVPSYLILSYLIYSSICLSSFDDLLLSKPLFHDYFVPHTWLFHAFWTNIFFVNHITQPLDSPYNLIFLFLYALP